MVFIVICIDSNHTSLPAYYIMILHSSTDKTPHRYCRAKMLRNAMIIPFNSQTLWQIYLPSEIFIQLTNNPSSN